jgi:hypothetical protein
MGIKPITISFKNTPEDMALYCWITNHSNLSGFIKDTLRAARDGKGGGNSSGPAQETKGSGLIDMDF